MFYLDTGMLIYALILTWKPYYTSPEAKRVLRNYSLGILFATILIAAALWPLMIVVWFIHRKD